MKKPLHIIKSFFEHGDVPTEQQFCDAWDSFHHKDSGVLLTSRTIDRQGNVTFTFSDGDSVTIDRFALPQQMPIAFIEGLADQLQSKVNKVTGKGLSSEDFTSNLKENLVQLSRFLGALQNAVFITTITNNAQGSELLFSNGETVVVEKLIETKVALNKAYEALNISADNFQSDFNESIYNVALQGNTIVDLIIEEETFLDTNELIDYLNNQDSIVIGVNQMLKVSYVSNTLNNLETIFTLPFGEYGNGKKQILENQIFITSYLSVSETQVNLAANYPAFNTSISSKQDSFNDVVHESLKSSLFPKMIFSWGYPSREFSITHMDNPTTGVTGSLNLLNVKLVGGLTTFLNLNPEILLYRYKSRKKVKYRDQTTGEPFRFIKKSGFYHERSPIDSKTVVIPITKRVQTLDFKLEGFFKAYADGMVRALGMKHNSRGTLYASKGEKKAYLYVNFRLRIKVGDKTYISDPSETIRAYFDNTFFEVPKISFERN